MYSLCFLFIQYPQGEKRSSLAGLSAVGAYYLPFLQLFSHSKNAPGGFQNRKFHLTRGKEFGDRVSIPEKIQIKKRPRGLSGSPGAGSPRSPDTTFNYFSKPIRAGSREGDCTDFPESQDRVSKVERILLYDREKRVRRGSVFIDKLPL